MTKTYDRLAAGERLRIKRNLLGWSQDEMAEKINRATKYYADIERGNCGMSIETLMALSNALNMSMDYILMGKESESKKLVHTDETSAVMDMLDNCTSKNRNYILQIIKLFLAACKNQTS
jgi:transcriptional regulator with XRE-family HTH domain